jgi:SsrA-binding protein
VAEHKGAAKKSGTPVIKLIADNKKARFDYSVTETFEAGIELTGSEVKSLRAGAVNLKDSYVAFKNGQAYLQNAHISEYRASSYQNHLPERHRKLLMKSTELGKIDRAISEKGYTCVPLKIYFKGQWAKLEIALVKGKNSADKRTSIKTREADRELAQVKRKYR